ncbi:hypothetical protein [Bradyrhizobium sp.]|uniref:hypothetical protein n=1 Tax=Bradyrhizobium sp. TaxID=376 RepID=UPI003F8D7604
MSAPILMSAGGRHSLNRFDQRFRSKWLRQIGNAPGFDGGSPNRVIVVGRDVDDRQGNARIDQSMAHLDPRNAIQLDVENDADRCIEIVAALERLRRVEERAIKAVLLQQAFDALQNADVVVDDKDESLVGQRATLDTDLVNQWNGDTLSSSVRRVRLA